MSYCFDVTVQRNFYFVVGNIFGFGFFDYPIFRIFGIRVNFEIKNTDYFGVETINEASDIFLTLDEVSEAFHILNFSQRDLFHIGIEELSFPFG